MPQGVPKFGRHTKHSCENCGAQSITPICWKCKVVDEQRPVFDRAHKRRVDSDKFKELDFNGA
jgi:hypothetical protein